ncbi:Endonuclease NucS [Stieleria bergensis]|uniref:Endonuclease NucS n=1 Tax=Stieleria bergensis TaxID=2528025 RepID=A0A517T1T6_9BACT|nr:Endonuclease NucS [Planctomycetes bacterium SV_7m_r]
MGDIKLFRTNGDAVEQLEGTSVALEKSLQELIEKHLETFLGVRFLASEYSTGKTHAGRIDTLGIDENGCAVIIEYKRSTNENVINQGLFYLDWLLDHKAEFELLVMKKYGSEVSETIEWSAPRLICIAGDFTKYDAHAVQQINRNIELIKYQRFADELLLLDLVHSVSVDSDTVVPATTTTTGGTPQTYKTVSEYLSEADPKTVDLFEAVKAYLLGLGDDVQVKTLKFYFAFKRIKNFACVEVRKQTGKVLIYAKVEPTPEVLEEGFTRDVREIGHFGTGDLEITLGSIEDLERAKPLLEQSYEAN